MVTRRTGKDVRNISHSAKGASVILAYGIRSGADQIVHHWQETRTWASIPRPRVLNVYLTGRVMIT